MGLFVCEECGHVENTALSHYWLRGQYGHDPRALCSHCDPGMEGHNRFPSKLWDGELVKNPGVIPRFVSFRHDPAKCSHLALGKAGSYHLGAIGVCKDCGIQTEVLDVGQKRREREKDSCYKTEDYQWSVFV